MRGISNKSSETAPTAPDDPMIYVEPQRLVGLTIARGRKCTKALRPTISNVRTTDNFYGYFEDILKSTKIYLCKFAESHLNIMKIHKIPTLLLAVISFNSCSQELPPYSHLNPGKPQQEKPKEEGKEDNAPATPSLGYIVTPSGDHAYIDEELTLEFKSAPSLGTTGQIRIYSSDGTEVDMIDMADVTATPAKMADTTPYTTCHDLLGPAALKRWRVVNYKPVTVDGNKVIIKPHSGRLEHAKSYYVVMDATVLNAEGFKGIQANEWQFKTAKVPASKSEVTVARSGEADFRTIQAAIDWAYACGGNNAMTINIKNGIYQEQLFARYNNKITFKGESREGTIIQYTNSEELAGGTGGSSGVAYEKGKAIGKSGGRAVILFEACDDIRFENMTLKNTYGRPGQAEVIYNNSDGDYNMSFVNCSLISLQDTFNTKGYVWMKDCLVEGDCDFIWGSPRICLFEDCEIRAAGDGYIVQARCQNQSYKGFVFLGCSLTKTASVADGSMYLARSSGAKEYYDNVAFINCRMSTAIPATGWYGNPGSNPSKANATSGWKEYGSKDLSGNTLSVSSRHPASYQLSESEYEAGYRDRAAIFAGAPVGTDWMK